MVDNGGMNRRIILNVMIVALLTFYMIFNIVYKRFSDQHVSEPEAASEAVVWDRPFLVPEQWQLARLEMPPVVIQLDVNDTWSSNEESLDSDTLALIAKSWQTLSATSAVDYMKLPMEGFTVLAFIREDSQPLVFRVLILSDEIHFFRMIDQKQFIYPISSKAHLLVN